VNGEVRQVTWRDRARYAFDNTMSRGAPALVGWLALATLALIALFTAIVLIGDLAPGDKPGVIRQVFNSFLHSIDSGTVAGDTGNWKFLLTMLLLTLGGLFIVSALIGVIATGLDNKLQELRKGRSFVIETGHTLILGWSETVFTILSELAIANESESDPVVVLLAERDKVEMEDEIRLKAGEMGKTRVVCRSGSPIDLKDLELVNPSRARSVIVLATGHDEPDAQVIKTVLALNRGPESGAGEFHIVAEISDPQNLEAARLVGSERTIFIDKRVTIARLLVQASRQAGASVVYGELLDFAGDEIYFRRDAGLEGRTFGDALLAYENAAVLGLRAGGIGTRLNPHPETIIAPGDEIIAVAADDDALVNARPFAGRIDEDAIGEAPPYEGHPQRILVLGWNSRGPSVVNELDHYVMPGSTVTVVAGVERAGSELEAQCRSLENLEATFKLGNTTDRRTLDLLDVMSYDQAIVLCYSEDLDLQRADARTLVTLLHLRDIEGNTREGGVSVTSEMLDDRNRELAQVTQVDDVIVSDRIISLMLAQISENPQLDEVFSELFAAEGSEIYLRPTTHYLRAGAVANFATVVEAARRRGEVALGYRAAAEAGDAERDFGVHVNPAKSATVEAGEDDRVIVLAVD
jgi:voltage-gated potassium channel Kch